MLKTKRWNCIFVEIRTFVCLQLRKALTQKKVPVTIVNEQISIQYSFDYLGSPVLMIVNIKITVS
jgi:hypothetical protein